MRELKKCAICNKETKLKNMGKIGNELCCEECCYYHETRVQEEMEWEQRMHEWEMEERKAGRI